MRTPRRFPTPARRASLALVAALAGTLAVALPADAATYPGPGPITIPDIGPATPYPSTLTVDGVPGVVTSVEVTLTGLTHTWLADVEVMVAGPGGGAVVLLADRGGGESVTGLNLTFSASASAQVPGTGSVSSGTYLPSPGSSAMPAPAPSASGSDLGVFAGADPNGTWSLYVLDDTMGDTGTLASWSLDIETEFTAQAGGPYTIVEGAALTLDASASQASSSATYAWDLDADGAYDDATGATPTVDAATLAALGLGDGPTGPLPVGLQVTDGADVQTASSTVTVTATAPTATVTLPRQVLADTPFTMKVGAVDPSPADATATFTYEIDWTGDGVVDQTLTGPADPPVTHSFATAGTYRVTVWATDRDGARSAPLAVDVVVAPALAASGGVPGTAWLALAALGLGGLLIAASHRLRRTQPSAR